MINTYRNPVELFVDGESIFLLKVLLKGTPWACHCMLWVYILPLIHSLDASSVTQIWYADDACACDSLKDLHHWWDNLLS